MQKIIPIILISAIFLFCFKSVYSDDENQQRSSYFVLKTTKMKIAEVKIINSFPHDQEAFTQGLFYKHGYLYESTGLKGKSKLRKINIKTGKVLQEIKLAKKYFAEGITLFGNKIYQITWQNNKVFVYDFLNLKLINYFSYQGEGWGITTDGKKLFMSNGSDVINRINPVNFTIENSINVHDGENAISNLNELEYIHGEIWANIFMQDVIARISPDTGAVLGWVDLTKLYSYLPVGCKANVLNGIAYDADNGRIFVTGKNWPKMFEIVLKKDDRN